MGDVSLAGRREEQVQSAIIESGPQCVLAAGNIVGESPVWVAPESCLYWCDICGFTLHRLHLPTGQHTNWKFPEPVVYVALTDQPGLLLVMLGSRIVLWSANGGEQHELVRPELEWPTHRLNDGGVDACGRLWAGSMPNNVGPNGELIPADGNTGKIFRVSGDGSIVVADSGYAIPNTFLWTRDGNTLICGCSKSNTLYAYTFDVERGLLSNRRVFAAGFARGVPDGSAMDAEGFIWNARFAGGCLVRFAPNGDVDQVIDMPVSNPTHCTFGGPDGRTLFVTSGTLLAPPGEALAGGVFSLRTRVSGTPQQVFRTRDGAATARPRT